MLRRDPTTIHLVADDLKDIGRDINFGEIPNNNVTNMNIDMNMNTNQNSVEYMTEKFNTDINPDIDNQNWDSSLDESYLGSRSRERGVEIERERAVSGVGNINNVTGYRDLYRSTDTQTGTLQMEIPQVKDTGNIETTNSSYGRGNSTGN